MSAPHAPSYRLDNKIALVTGSGRGMGRQNSLELAGRGASLVINYAKSADAAQKVVSEIEALGGKAVAIKGDVSHPEEIVSLFDKAMKHYGRIDIVVSNSGVESFGHISEITPEEFNRVFTVNTRGQLLVAQQAYKHLTPGGRLVMLSSISASARGVANHAVYSGSKNAVEAFVRCLAVGKFSFAPDYLWPLQLGLLNHQQLRFRRQAHHGERDCARWHQDRHVDRSRPKVYSRCRKLFGRKGR